MPNKTSIHPRRCRCQFGVVHVTAGVGEDLGFEAEAGDAFAVGALCGLAAGEVSSRYSTPKASSNWAISSF
ncbi:MAG: hypothetical protein R2856_30950 [Caldilineaceae bacterium]